MILWIALFLLVVAISFVLALRSMRDYQDIPQRKKEEYGLFLIRQPGNFSAQILDHIGKAMLVDGLIISLERLFKGSQAALTIFGPKRMLDQFMESLSLLELEDYTEGYSSSEVAVWEMGVRETGHQSVNTVFENISRLGADEQFFWQLVLGAKKIKETIVFQTQIRAVVYSKDPLRRKVLVPLFENLQAGSLIKVPKPFSTEQMMDFYRLRSLGKDSSGPVLDTEAVIRLLKV
ncbi:hypothetical protein HYU45_04260 [Candidatus Daviesbacteria bacterium]|nr:hypothetical protein [Candidatus Daviesbacteria bacterium]